MASPRRKRPNRAAFQRALAAQEATPPMRDLPDELVAVINAHTPRCKQGRPMEVIRPFLFDVIARSELTGKESVRKHCTHLTEFAAFALERGKTLSVPGVMTSRFIDEYARVGMVGDASSRRSHLLSLAGKVNPGPDAPAQLTPISHRSVKAPYTPTERTVIIRVSQVQPSAARRLNLMTVVGLAAGAGLDSVDMRHGRVGDVEDQEAAGLVVHVRGPRPRVVPVRAALEPLLREAVDGRRPDELLIGQKEDRRNTAGRARERGALYHVPHIEPGRLRATWLADLMTDSIPVGLILRAAGLRSARSLVDIQPHLGPWLDHKGLSTPTHEILRGDAA